MADLIAWKEEPGVDYIVVDTNGKMVEECLWFVALESGCFNDEYERLLHIANVHLMDAR